MNFLRKFLGSSSVDEVVSIPSGKLFLTRSPQSPKGELECLYNDSFASIRQTSTAYTYRLVVTRVYQEGELVTKGDNEYESTDDEEEFSELDSINEHIGRSSSKDEYGFIISEELKLHCYEKEDGSRAISWKELTGDPGDRFEFVIDQDSKQTDVDAFMLALYKCQYEHKYHRSNLEISSPKVLKEFVYHPKVEKFNLENLHNIAENYNPTGYSLPKNNGNDNIRVRNLNKQQKKPPSISHVKQHASSSYSQSYDDPFNSGISHSNIEPSNLSRIRNKNDNDNFVHDYSNKSGKVERDLKVNGVLKDSLLPTKSLENKYQKQKEDYDDYEDDDDEDDDDDDDDEDEDEDDDDDDEEDDEDEDADDEDEDDDDEDEADDGGDGENDDDDSTDKFYDAVGVIEGDSVYDNSNLSLYLYDPKSESFILSSKSSDVLLDIIHLRSWQYKLSIHAINKLGKSFLIEVNLSKDLNPTFNFEKKSFVFNQTNEDDSVVYSWLLKFESDQELTEFQIAYSTHLWESIHKQKFGEPSDSKNINVSSQSDLKSIDCISEAMERTQLNDL